MNEETFIRLSCLGWPALVLLVVLYWRKLDARLAGAALLATFWNLSALLVLNVIAQACGWWRFHAEGGLFLGMPAELYFGWALLWGALPVLMFLDRPVWQAILAMLTVDLLLMPACADVVQLGNRWLIGEGVGLVLALVPALYLARWSLRRERLKMRVSLLVIAYALLLAVLIPSLLLEASHDSWERILTRPAIATGIVLQSFFLIAVPALSAVQEFCLRGAGTPLPFDPPRRLVTSGPFAYIANPMQTGTVWLCTGLAFWIANPWIAAVTFASVSSLVAIACWQEETTMAKRYGNAWTIYRSEVRAWWPRWKPRVHVPCKIYIAETCGACRGLAKWLESKHPRGLLIVAAETHPTRRLRRITYEAPGWTEDGVGALARAFEHIHFGWAWLGWTLRLPMISHLAQWLTDLSGGGSREVGLEIAKRD